MINPIGDGPMAELAAAIAFTCIILPIAINITNRVYGGVYIWPGLWVGIFVGSLCLFGPLTFARYHGLGGVAEWVAIALSLVLAFVCWKAGEWLNLSAGLTEKRYPNRYEARRTSAALLLAALVAVGVSLYFPMSPYLARLCFLVSGIWGFTSIIMAVTGSERDEEKRELAEEEAHRRSLDNFKPYQSFINRED